MSQAPFSIRPIRSETDYRAALQLVAHYFDDEPEPGRLEWQLQHLCAAR